MHLPRDQHPHMESHQSFSLEDYRCPICTSILRPHVLWFDEYYSEELYKAQSAMHSTYETQVLVVCGTSGSTNLPLQMMELAHQRNALIIDINPDRSPFSGVGDWWQCTATEGIQRLSSLVTA